MVTRPKKSLSLALSDRESKAQIEFISIPVPYNTLIFSLSPAIIDSDTPRCCHVYSYQMKEQYQT